MSKKLLLLSWLLILLISNWAKAQCTYTTNQSISAATFLACGSITVNAGVTLTVTGAVTNNTGGANITVTDNGSLVFNSGITLNSSGNLSVTGTGSMSVTGGLTINSSGSYTNGVNTSYSGSITGGSTGSVTNTGTLTVSGSITLNSNGGLNNSGTISAGSLTIASSGGVTNTGSFSVTGTLTQNSSGSFTDNGILTVDGNYNIESSGGISGTGTATVTGTASTTSSGTFFGTSGCTGGCTFSSSGAGSTNNCSYKYTRKIKLDHTKVSGGAYLTNFPVLISTVGLADEALFKSVSNSGHVQSTSGYDIIFFDADGVTPLSFQMENYVATTGEYEAWVNIPSLSNTVDTYIYMNYGDASVTENQSSTATWDSNYQGVWHFNSSLNDGTSNAHTATNSGSTYTTTAKIAGGVNFSGTTTNYVHVPISSGMSSAGGTGNGTIELWGDITTYGNSTYFFGESSTQTGEAYTNRVQIYQNSTSGQLELGLGGTHALANAGTLTTGTWNHIVLTWATTGTGVGNYTVYVNGANAALGAYTAFTALANFGDMGNDGNASQETEGLTGNTDETRISNITRTAGWITTEYNSQNSPSTFAIISSEPNTWVGTSSTAWTTNGNWSSGTAPVSGTGIDVIISNGTNQPTLGTNTQVGSISIASGAKLTLGAGYSLSVANDVINCGTLTSVSTGSLVMNSASAINQNISGSGTYSLGNLTIDNTVASSTVTLNVPVTVSKVLTLTSGLLNTTTTNILTLQNGATAPALTSAATSYVNGPMDCQLASTTKTTLNFPIGTGGDCRPVALTVAHTTTNTYNYTGQLFSGSAFSVGTYTNFPATVDTLSGVHYYDIARTDASATSQPTLELSGNQTIQIYFGTDDVVKDGGLLTICKTYTNSTDWVDIGQGSTTIGSTQQSTAQVGSITSSTGGPTAFNSFSYFALGRTAGAGSNPLPIQLLNFTAVPNGEKVDIAWQTSTEQNNAYFTIEKSKDGTNFTKLIDVPGAGNSTVERDYAETDYQPYGGTSYYRLKQTDENGNYKYFYIVPVDFNAQQNIIVYPNPMASGNNMGLKVTGYQNQAVTVVLTDMQGRQFLTQVLLTVDNDHIFVVDETGSLPPGSYVVTASTNDKIYNSKLIVQ